MSHEKEPVARIDLRVEFKEQKGGRKGPLKRTAAFNGAITGLGNKLNGLGRVSYSEDKIQWYIVLNDRTEETRAKVTAILKRCGLEPL